MSDTVSAVCTAQRTRAASLGPSHCGSFTASGSTRMATAHGVDEAEQLLRYAVEQICPAAVEVLSKHGKNRVQVLASVLCATWTPMLPASRVMN